MTIAIYCRVSSEKQREEKTIDAQLDQNRKHSANKTIYKEYVDDGWSGATLRRPGLTALREDASKGKFEEVHIVNLSRFARNATKQGILIDELQKAGIEIIVAGKPLDKTKEGKFLLTILAGAHELQKEMIIEATSKGRWFKAQNKKMIQPTAPFGYKFLRNERGDYKRDEKGGKIIAIDEKESKIIKQIFDRYLNIQNCYKLVKELNSQGLRTRKGFKFSQAYAKAILVNDVYTGNWYYGKRMAVEPKERRNKDFIRNLKSSSRIRDRKDWIHFEVPAIITKGTFDEVQRVFEKRKGIKGKLTQTYMLNGLLYCDHCGWKMYGRKTPSGKNVFYYYACSRKTKPHISTTPQCNHPSPRVEILDQVIWEKIMSCFKNPEKIFKETIDLNDEENNVSIIQDRRNALLKKKEFIKESRMKCLELYEVDEMSKEVLIDRNRHHNKNEALIDDDLREVEILFNQIARKKQIIKKAKAFAKILCKNYNFTLEQKRDFVMEFIDEIRYNPITRDIEITGDLPILENVEQLDNFIVDSVELLK